MQVLSEWRDFFETNLHVSVCGEELAHCDLMTQMVCCIIYVSRNALIADTILNQWTTLYA